MLNLLLLTEYIAHSNGTNTHPYMPWNNIFEQRLTVTKIRSLASNDVTCRKACVFNVCIIGDITTAKLKKKRAILSIYIENVRNGLLMSIEQIKIIFFSKEIIYSSCWANKNNFLFKEKYFLHISGIIIALLFHILFRV